MATEGFKKVFVSESGQAVVATGWDDDWPKGKNRPVSGEVSATEFKPGEWYLNRAIVGPDEARGKGLGTQLLKLLLERISSKSNFQRISVEPGGYHTDLAKQVRFYTKNGFMKDTSENNTYYWMKKGEQHAESA